MKLFIVSTALNEGHAYGRLKDILQDAGHEVLEPPDATHTWSYIATNYTLWDPLEYRKNLYSAGVLEHFEQVKKVMTLAEGCVLMLPASPASHMVAGWIAGSGKPLFIVFLEPGDPNLMHLLADRITVGSAELGEALNEVSTVELDKKRFFDYVMDMLGLDATGVVEIEKDGAFVHTVLYVDNDDLENPDGT